MQTGQHGVPTRLASALILALLPTISIPAQERENPRLILQITVDAMHRLMGFEDVWDFERKWSELTW